MEKIHIRDDIMEEIIALIIISGTTILFIKYIIFGDIVEKNLDKIIMFFNRKRKLHVKYK